MGDKSDNSGSTSDIGRTISSSSIQKSFDAISSRLESLIIPGYASSQDGFPGFLANINPEDLVNVVLGTVENYNAFRLANDVPPDTSNRAIVQSAILYQFAQHGGLVHFHDEVTELGAAMLIQDLERVLPYGYKLATLKQVSREVGDQRWHESGFWADDHPAFNYQNNITVVDTNDPGVSYEWNDAIIGTDCANALLSINDSLRDPGSIDEIAKKLSSLKQTEVKSETVESLLIGLVDKWRDVELERIIYWQLNAPKLKFWDKTNGASHDFEQRNPEKVIKSYVDNAGHVLRVISNLTNVQFSLVEQDTYKMCFESLGWSDFVNEDTVYRNLTSTTRNRIIRTVVEPSTDKASKPGRINAPVHEILDLFTIIPKAGKNEGKVILDPEMIDRHYHLIDIFPKYSCAIEDVIEYMICFESEMGPNQKKKFFENYCSMFAKEFSSIHGIEGLPRAAENIVNHFKMGRTPMEMYRNLRKIGFFMSEFGKKNLVKKVQGIVSPEEYENKQQFYNENIMHHYISLVDLTEKMVYTLETGSLPRTGGNYEPILDNEAHRIYLKYHQSFSDMFSGSKFNISDFKKQMGELKGYVPKDKRKNPPGSLTSLYKWASLKFMSRMHDKIQNIRTIQYQAMQIGDKTISDEFVKIDLRRS